MAALKSPADCALTACSRCDSKSLCAVDWPPPACATASCPLHRHSVANSRTTLRLMQRPRQSCLRRAGGCIGGEVGRGRVITLLLGPLDAKIGSVSIIGHGTC